MVDAFDIYLFGLLFNLRDIFNDIGFFTAVSTLLLIIAVPILYDFKEEKITPVAKKLGIIISITFALCIVGKNLSPTKEIATAMFVVPPVVNNEKIQEIPDNVLDFVNGWLKENAPKEHSKESF